MKTQYMHLIDHRPAVYYPKTQICYLAHGRQLKLCNSLDQIRKEQEACMQWRFLQGYKTDASSYSYLRIKI